MTLVLQVHLLTNLQFSLGTWEGDKFIEGCVGDNGKSYVIQQTQHVSNGRKTLAGCPLVDNVFDDPDFSEGIGSWNALPGFDNADLGLRAEITNNEL
jgi:hypothetical protein